MRELTGRLARALVIILSFAAPASALYYFVLKEHVKSPYVGLAQERSPRRRAVPEAYSPPLDLPLTRLSRVHLAVDVTVRARGVNRNKPWSRELDARVVLDTGASLAFGTADLGGDLPLRMAANSRSARGFSGARGSLYPIERGDSVTLTVAPGQPRAVTVPLEYVAPVTLHGAEIIAPPQALAPIGGAVRLDFEHDRLTICESIDSCRPGAGWVALSNRPCAEDPELVAVEAAVNGQPLALHLDTGAPTLMFRRYFDAAKLGETTHGTGRGSLAGINGVESEAIVASGNWRFGLGVGERVNRTAYVLWVVGNTGDAGPTRCFPAGSVGSDVLQGCQVVLSESIPTRGYLRCTP